MLNYYYDLHNDDQLPVGGKFFDPYDRTLFRTQLNTTLPEFIKQIKISREEKEYPQLLDSELHQLVVASLYESCPPQLRGKYFVKRVATANLSQVVSLATTLAYNLIHHENAASLKTREQRAAKCLDKCIFHRQGSSWSKVVSKVINSITGLKDLVQSESETKLGTCGMCGGCNLQDKVKLPLVSIIAGLHPERLDLLVRAYKEKAFSKCWIAEEALQNAVTKKYLSNRLKNGEAEGLKYLDLHTSNQIKKAKQSTPNKKQNVS